VRSTGLCKCEGGCVNNEDDLFIYWFIDRLAIVIIALMSCFSVMNMLNKGTLVHSISVIFNNVCVYLQSLLKFKGWPVEVRFEYSWCTFGSVTIKRFQFLLSPILDFQIMAISISTTVKNTKFRFLVVKTPEKVYLFATLRLFID